MGGSEGWGEGKLSFLRVEGGDHQGFRNAATDTPTAFLRANLC